jgi:hypothetical protein
MSIKRTLTESEKEQVIKQHGRRCFVDGEPISEEETLEFHHIKPFSEGGPTTIDNIAPVCKRHHLTIGTMSLQEYRDKLELGKFFEDGQPKYLDDLIRYKKINYGEKIKYELIEDDINIYFKDLCHIYPIHMCSTKGWKYFYATLAVEAISNDSDLQPRPLREPSLWALYRHFQTNTQLALSICRINEDNKILLFDGQHKAAAQIWANRKRIECKIYLNPDSRELKETNLAAHTLYRQMSFYSHELMKKYADIFGEDWAEYMGTEGEKSESGFFNYLVYGKNKTKANAKNEIALAIYNEIVDDSNNKLSTYLSEKNRGRKQPITFSRLKKTFFQHMIMSPPVKDEFESDKDYRKDERQNLIKIMNIITDEGLSGKWAPERADSSHKKAERIFSAGAIRAWVILLKDVINTHLRHYTDEERRLFFYKKIPDEAFSFFRKFVKRIYSHKLWDDPDASGEITARLARDDATTAKSLFDEKGLTVTWVLTFDN